ncbi:methyltransferase domain-containing protein [Streptomyces sp. HNM0574]|uniref:methyltransferase domain-containing protein n=1 Tax=Streptomyces sp. HNM0574 TaxID=2714954 RepID=UPI00146E1700|nr:methyltransferase domain-containing protein [Streptomyces sp. HNM0574]NLU66417.1 methyltransferase domain-containing protein [Streptomyces sp. HNM0574]
MGAASGLVREIVAGGALTDPDWRAAFEEVLRETFVPYYYATGPDGDYRRLWRDDPDPRVRDRWRAGVYDDVPLATRVRDGVLVSSSSQPSLMARMLEALDFRDGMTVLEIGTGPGWTAGLLSHRLGERNVTTVDLDRDITDAARAHLAAAGHHPHVVTGDGALGCPEHAPYDRIIATCELPRVPPGWLAQCAPGALVLAPVATGLVRLRVTDASHAAGHFLATPAFFVPLRGATPPPPPAPGLSGVPRRARSDDSFRFLLALCAGQLEAADAYRLWRDEDCPPRERYGMTVGDGGQWAWLDREEGPYGWPFDAPGGDGT